jgi:hypothetical protein
MAIENKDSVNHLMGAIESGPNAYTWPIPRWR